ncbi:MAG: hypothetical protein AMS18_12145, partial [Gemmatimonas sp. SG8_17]
MPSRRHTWVVLVCLVALWIPSRSGGQITTVAAEATVFPSQATCDYSRLPGAVWWGTKQRMTLNEFASYTAPIYWFSPDEPTMDDLEGKDLRIPQALPFESQPDSPVVYYQYNNIGRRTDEEGPAFIPDSTNMANSIIELQNVVAMNLKYIAYFPREEGLGGHEHDVEPAEFRIWVLRSTTPLLIEDYGVECDQLMYVIGVLRVTAEAHGLEWYFNVLDVDEYTKFPMTLIAEEGKHGMCTDKNADGY